MCEFLVKFKNVKKVYKTRHLKVMANLLNPLLLYLYDAF